jgi:hypothetical protein
MIVIHIFSRFFKRIGNVFVQYLQNESPYMIAMVITYVGVRNEYNSKCDTFNSEYIAANSKYYRLSYIHFFGLLIFITSTKLKLELL